MLKINLLDKKTNASENPLAAVMEKIGLSDINPEDLAVIRSLIFKAIVISIIFYLSNYVPEYIRLKKIAELDQKINAVNQEVAKLEKELKEKQAVRSEMDRIINAEAGIKAKLQVVTSLDTDRYRAFKMFDTISAVIPERTWIDNISFNQNTLDISGASWEKPPVTDFLTLLKQSSIFEGVTLKQIDIVPGPKQVQGVPAALQKLNKFDVTMQVKTLQSVPAKSPSEKGNG